MDNVEGVLFFFGYIYRDVINNFIVMDMLEEEFFVYQVMREVDILVYIWKELKVEEKLDNDNVEIVMYYCMDMIWGSL